MGIFSNGWLVFGLLGQIIFTARFLFQWLYSEYKRHSAFPMAFWYASVLGGLILLCYACHKEDPVFMVGQTGGLLIYLRNLQLRLREKKEHARGSAPSVP
ncbi:lipid-A-disaccharide synthase N-terminal domain-containing protein [Dyella caseinilytica]|uniref:Lipid-A-disaccharide synthase N-terminal domain-containing protein n=1 Tax=Dyella caseinilytica TaxID=1849581 RepID=A0ABX7GRI4_9GAMM|nr:lipid-A-disaccharide synthase N-terminal domain-containing protein [Dyella caseinilytica]QRN52997.1 lipid-A-disaccharide synthase N-terminal domain-containing protein [Dyella caseinilytica]GGA10661.1 hypothetical protein GCM10011408_34950 [Dyella caseinilytica]